MSRVLITGANGFVGHAVCMALRKRGHLLSGTTRNTAHRAGPEGTPLYVVPEFGPDMDWSRAVAGADIIVHLAARTHVMTDKARDPQGTLLADYLRVNVDGTRRLAEAAVAAGVKRLVFLSSVKAIGETSSTDGLDETTPPAPEDAYGISKLEAEQVLADITRSSRLETVILRPPLVYGPHVKGNFLALLRLCDTPFPLPFGAVANKRSLISADNLGDAIAVAAEHPKAAGEAFFVSDGEPVSTAELIRRIRGKLGRPPRLMNAPRSLLGLLGTVTGKRDQIQRLTGTLVLNDRKIRSFLGWAPPETFDSGLSKTVAWFRSQP